MNEGDSTVATVEESLDSSLNEGSAFQPGSECNKISLLVNGTRYIGSVSPTDSPCRANVEDSNSVPTTGESCRGETRKEQGRRLLFQHRNYQSLSAKPKRIKQWMTVLQTIEEACCVVNDSKPVVADTEVAPKVITHDHTTDDDRRRDIKLILERKFKTSGTHKRNASSMREKPAKISSPMNVFWYGCWRDVVLTVAYFIPWFSSSAARYARFRSNQRFKPGD